MDQASFSLADLTRVTGLPRRTVQFLADNAVLKADPATIRRGSGARRQFSRLEAIVGCVLRPLVRRSKSTVGELQKMSEAIRECYRHDKHRIAIEDVLSKRVMAYMVI